MLTFVREALTADPDGHLLADPYFADVIHHALPPWRRVVTAATTAGLPVPAHAAAQQFVTGRLVTVTR